MCTALPLDELSIHARPARATMRPIITVDVVLFGAIQLSDLCLNLEDSTGSIYRRQQFFHKTW